LFAQKVKQKEHHKNQPKAFLGAQGLAAWLRKFSVRTFCGRLPHSAKLNK